jgi:uncharacterized protein YkwD
MKSVSRFPALILLIVFTAQGITGQKRRTPRSAQPRLKSIAGKAKAPANTPSTKEDAILTEINLARSNPVQYIRYLEDFRRYYREKELRFPDGQTVITREGVAALDEAINFLRSVRPLPSLESRNAMVLAAKDHLSDLVRSGRSSHEGSDGSLPGGRISRYGIWSESVGEDIIYHSRRAREDVVSLIIDDGVANRGHRKNIFKANFRVIGIALSQPLKFGTVGVITFAGRFAPRR